MLNTINCPIYTSLSKNVMTDLVKSDFYYILANNIKVILILILESVTMLINYNNT